MRAIRNKTGSTNSRPIDIYFMFLNHMTHMAIEKKCATVKGTWVWSTSGKTLAAEICFGHAVESEVVCLYRRWGWCMFNEKVNTAVCHSLG